MTKPAMSDDITAQLVVTEEDRVLCDECLAEQVNEWDRGTWAFAKIGFGSCEVCGAASIALSEEGE